MLPYHLVTKTVMLPSRLLKTKEVRAYTKSVIHTWILGPKVVTEGKPGVPAVRLKPGGVSVFSFNVKGTYCHHCLI